MAHACISALWEAEVGGSLEPGRDQTGQCNETLSLKKKLAGHGGARLYLPAEVQENCLNLQKAEVAVSQDCAIALRVWVTTVKLCLKKKKKEVCNFDFP